MSTDLSSQFSLINIFPYLKCFVSNSLRHGSNTEKNKTKTKGPRPCLVLKEEEQPYFIEDKIDESRDRVQCTVQ